MQHLSEEQLIAFQDGDDAVRKEWAQHVSECVDCRAELDGIEGMLVAFQALPVPEPGTEYGRKVWQQIAPELREKRSPWWKAFLEPRYLTAAGLVTALLLVAFLAGRVSKRVDDGPVANGTVATTTEAQVRERVLMLAVGEHLGRSEMVLMEIANAQPGGTGEDAGLKNVNLTSQRRRAEDLLDENRLYRQTALQEGDLGLANVLDELERVLIDVAHSPQTVTPARFKTIQHRIADNGLLFKVRVLAKQIHEQQRDGTDRPAQRGAAKMEKPNMEKNEA